MAEPAFDLAHRPTVATVFEDPLPETLQGDGRRLQNPDLGHALVVVDVLAPRVFQAVVVPPAERPQAVADHAALALGTVAVDHADLRRLPARLLQRPIALRLELLERLLPGVAVQIEFPHVAVRLV